MNSTGAYNEPLDKGCINFKGVGSNDQHILHGIWLLVHHVTSRYFFIMIVSKHRRNHTFPMVGCSSLQHYIHSIGLSSVWGQSVINDCWGLLTTSPGHRFNEMYWIWCPVTVYNGNKNAVYFYTVNVGIHAGWILHTNTDNFHNYLECWAMKTIIFASMMRCIWVIV